MHGKIVLAGLILGVCGVAASAQDRTAPFPNNVYCSDVVTSEVIPRDTYVITGEESGSRVVFSENENVFINKGTSQGVKTGDEFLVVRPIEDAGRVEWTQGQSSILHRMGTMWEDEGRLKVTEARAEVSIAQIERGCNYVQRGDIVLPFVRRPEPTLKPVGNFDKFLVPDGKPLAMVVTGQRFNPQMGRNEFIYVNLGNSQGVKVGDYFRIFRYTGIQHETVYQTPRYAFDVAGDLGPTYGFGAAPRKWDWNNVPREVLGEGVVLRTGPNSATVLITFSTREIYAGDYVELE
jgi:hypothetical protein